MLLAAPMNKSSATAIYPIRSRNGPNDKIFHTKIPATSSGANIQKNTTSDLELLPALETISVYSKTQKIIKVDSTTPIRFLVPCFQLSFSWVSYGIDLDSMNNH